MASTYVNNLRRNEMGTGDAAGTWGTTTNTNLELIGEALGFGTEAITTNADTHTTTVADGASDAGRAMYLKYTGTLDSACTITIAPNTMKRMQLIENGTSGSQNIIISQGSGANITIPPGDTKAVYLDGAGSGAAVVDAFASLSTVDLKVQDDLTVTDDASIGGDATITGTLGVSGLLTANANVTLAGTTPTLTIGDAGAEDTKIVFDGNAQDFYIGLDDSADDLLIGLGSNVGTTPAISIDENLDATFAGVIQPPSANAIDLGVNGAEFRSLYLDTSLIASNELTIATGTNLVVDAASVIKLDADGGEVAFLDGGTEVGVISMGSSNMNIESKVADKDIVFKGIDGSSDVTALTLDMSGGGLAVFGGGINSSTSTNSTTHSLLTLESSVNANPSRMNMFFKSGNGTIAAISGRQNAGGSDAYGALDFNTSDAGTLATKMTILNNGELELKGCTYLASSGVTSIAWTNGSVSLADNTALTLTDIANTGALVSIGQNRSNQGVTYDHALFFMETGTAPTFVANPSGRFGASSGTDTLTNIYASGASMVIENKVGTTVTYSVAINRYLGN